MQGQSSPQPQHTLGYRLLSSPQRTFGPWHLVWPHLPGLRFSLHQAHLPYVPPENPSITVCPAGPWGNPDAHSRAPFAAFPQVLQWRQTASLQGRRQSAVLE